MVRCGGMAVQRERRVSDRFIENSLVELAPLEDATGRQLVDSLIACL